jgi:competence protein ComEA
MAGGRAFTSTLSSTNPDAMLAAPARCDSRTHMTQTLFTLAIVLTLTAAAPIAAQDRSSRSGSSEAAPAAALNLNTATAAQLEALPGIGKSTAERIVEYRQKNGGFKKVEDLMNVQGIGEKSFLKLKPLITVTTSRPDRAS